MELQNPDFIKLAESYHIKSKRIKIPGKVFRTVKEALKLRKPYITQHSGILPSH